MKGMGGREGGREQRWGSLLSRSTWQFFPKVREQSTFRGEEVKLSLGLQFISFPLRFTAVSWSTPLHEKSTHTRARAVVRAHKHGQWRAYHRSSIMVVYVHARSRHTLRKEETGIGWVVKYRAELNQRLKQDCNTNSRLKQLLSCKKWRRYEPDRSIFHKSWVWESRETSFQLLSLVTRWMFCQIRVKFSTM